MIEKHVPSLKLCKELKRLGFPQDTEFYWDDLGHRFTIEYAPKSNTKRFICAAPLVSEMASWIIVGCRFELLPHLVNWKWMITHDTLEDTPFTGSMPDAYATQCIEILKAKEKP